MMQDAWRVPSALMLTEEYMPPGRSDRLMAKLQKVLRLIEEPEPTDTSLEFHSLPPIVRTGDEDLRCGSCNAVIAESVSPRDLYVAAAALLRNRMPVRLILTCTSCNVHNVIPPPMID
jgi:hypothetical protein